jgi:hypothetical protein
VARGRTGAEGRFTLQRPAWLAGENGYVTPILWAVKPGFRLGFVRFPGLLPKPSEPVRVALGPPGKGEVRVEGPNGEPIAGARIRLEWFGRGQINVPEAVEDLIEAVTDKDGLAVLDAAANDQIAYVDVHAKGFGIQGRPFYRVSSKPKHVRLRPVASLEGRLQADDAAMVNGWRVFAYTRVGEPWSRDPATTGFDKGTTDAEGRFSFPVIAPGTLQLDLKPPGDLLVLADVPDSLAVIAGRTNSVVIPLRKPVAVTGVVRERGTGRPVPGAVMHFSRLQGGMVTTATTDAQGRYTFRSLPGRWRISPYQVPPTLVLAPGQTWRDVTISADHGPVELEPWEAIPAAPPLRFVVRDEQGRPAAHARITGWSGSLYIPQETDDKGEFTVPGLPPGGEVSIELRQGERMTDGRVKAIAGSPDPVPVTIVPGLTLALTGRVLTPGGAPIADAVVYVQYREDRPSPVSQGSIAFGDRDEIRTGPDGTFRTPKEIYRKNRQFRVEARAEGFVDAHTDWTASERGDLLTLRDLVLRPLTPLRSVAGRVLDRRGEGVAGVAVFQSGSNRGQTATTTDAAGRFRLDGVPGGAALLFAEKAGFRFGGAIVGPGDARVDIRLARVDEPPLSIPKPVPPPLPRAEERALARELLAPLIAAARAGSLGFAGRSVLPALARVDPDRVLEMLDNRTIDQGSNVLYQVALTRLEDDAKAAIATIEDNHDPAVRAEGFLKLADAMVADRARRNELLDRALAGARQVENKESRLGILGQIADRWLDLGVPDRARAVIREGQTVIASMPKDRYSYVVEQFGEVLAVIDLPAARALFERKGVTNSGAAQPELISRHLGEAAIRLAAVDPAAAEQIVPGDVPNFWDVRDYVLRIARRMARADLPRARKVLDAIDERVGPERIPRPPQKPEGLGLMAIELAETDPAGARRLLDEAFDRLRAVAADGRPFKDPSAATIMAALLPLVERVEPDRLEERLWLAVAVRAPIYDQPTILVLQPPIILASLVSRYDRAMAAAIIAPALEHLPGVLGDTFGASYDKSTMFKALAAYDPRAVIALLRELPDSARRAPARNDGWNGASLDAQIRVAAAEALGLPVEERRRNILEGDQALRLFARDR